MVKRRKSWRSVFYLLFVIFFLLQTKQGVADTLSRLTSAIPNSWGLHVSFINPQPGELKMLSETGARWVRLSLYWSVIEQVKGKYDFTLYDRLIAELEPLHIRPVFIVWFSNAHYDKDLSPYTNEGRQAFARWISASVKHYAGKGVIWEMWNEPNIDRFWKPHVKVEDYIKLAIAVGKAIQEVSSDEIYVGPSASMMDFKFLEACFQAGLLDYWSGVTVHPYRNGPPESWEKDLNKLKDLIGRYLSPGRSVSIITGEWGYSDISFRINEKIQAKYLPRQLLFNLANKVPLTIWFDWWDNGPDPKDSEHHFGIVKHSYYPERQNVFDPKLAYFAAKTLTGALDGFQFSHRLMIGEIYDYVLLFKRGSQYRIAAWTTSKRHRSVFVPASLGTIEVIHYLGEKGAPIVSSEKGFLLELSDAPQYLIPEKSDDLLRLVSGKDLFDPNFMRNRHHPCLPPNLPEWRCYGE